MSQTPEACANSIGAANTIFRNRDGGLQATNTDAAGFFAPIADGDWVGAPVALIGAGGAASGNIICARPGRCWRSHLAGAKSA